VRQIVLVEGFLTAKISRLDAIVEMRSIVPTVLSSGGRANLATSYSLFAFLIPVTYVYCAWRGWRERATGRVFFWLCCLLGIPMMLSQVRLHYYGSFALYLPWLVFLQDFATKREAQRKLIMLSASLVFAVAYIMPARNLTSAWDVANDGYFPLLRPILEDLRKACAEEPGIVLADNDAGHYIRYYTDCSVIANNFLLTPQHEQKIKQIDYLTSLPASAFPGIAPYVRYVLLRPASMFDVLKKDNKIVNVTYVSYSPHKAQLISDLLLKPLDQIPRNYVLLQEANIHDSSKDGVLPYMRLFKVNPISPPVARTSEATSTADHGRPLPTSSLNPVVH
jgi:hypothetical protein